MNNTEQKTDTIKIQGPHGFEAESFSSSGTVEIKFKPKPKNVIERVKTVDDVIRELGEDDEDVLIFKKLLSWFTLDSHVVNNQLAVLITKALNEGWVPDWSNSNETKYVPWFEMKGSSGFRYYVGHCDYWGSGSGVGSRLCFKSRELAEYAGKQFTFTYKKFMTID